MVLADMKCSHEKKDRFRVIPETVQARTEVLGDYDMWLQCTARAPGPCFGETNAEPRHKIYDNH